MNKELKVMVGFYNEDGEKIDNNDNIEDVKKIVVKCDAGKSITEVVLDVEKELEGYIIKREGKDVFKDREEQLDGDIPDKSKDSFKSMLRSIYDNIEKIEEEIETLAEIVSKEYVSDKLKALVMEIMKKKEELSSLNKSKKGIEKELDKVSLSLVDTQVPVVTLNLNGEKFEIDTVIDSSVRQDGNTQIELEFDGYNKNLFKMLKIGNTFTLTLDSELRDKNCVFKEDLTETYENMKLISMVKERNCDLDKKKHSVKVVFGNKALEVDSNQINPEWCKAIEERVELLTNALSSHFKAILGE